MDETAPWRLEIDDVIISSLPRVFPRRVLAKICHIEHVLMVTAASKEYRYVVLTDNSFYIFTRDALLKGTKKRGTHAAPPARRPGFCCLLLTARASGAPCLWQIASPRRRQ